METLKKIISRYMHRTTAVLLFFMLSLVLYVELTSEQRRAYSDSIRSFTLIEQLLSKNSEELEEIQAEYNQTCLHNAETIARIIESDPDILNDLEELNEVAVSMEVDEIHIFDETGRIVNGTHPEYYDYTFDSGEQMMFFKPMLTNKTLKLVQGITPNTSQGKLMQYSAVWNTDGTFIVQVGMEPVNVLKVTEKNELSYIFSMFRVNPDGDYYAIDAETGKIIGSTNLTCVGSNLTDIGFSFDTIQHNTDGFHAKINNQYSFCIFQKIGENYVGKVITTRNLYQRIPVSMLLLFICLTAAAFVLKHAVTTHMNKLVVDRIHDVNDKLNSISDGNLDEVIDIQNSVEFSELSSYINRMIRSLLDNNARIAYILSKTDLLIGVYEYNSNMKRVRFSEYTPQILSLDAKTAEELSLNTKKFRSFVNSLHQNPVPGEPGVYIIREKYIRLEEIVSDDGVFGVAIDVTAEIVRRREIESERDLDLLTGLYNRRGLDLKLTELFRTPEELGYSALVMIDADGLKIINDTYGHEAGDIYLKGIAEIINNFGSKNCIASRQGGDEFVLFLYKYDAEEELLQILGALEYAQNNSTVHIRQEHVPLRFSFGYSLARGASDYQQLLKEADEKMYQNKLERRKSIR